MTLLENRSLDRGITVMEILARTGACTLADLHRESGLAKSTIRRLLGTLKERRIIRRSLADKKYRINITLPAGVGEPVADETALIVDVAVPVLTELTVQLGWPSDIHLIDGNTMRIVDSTRPLSPFHLFRGVVNCRLNIFGSASGRICLATMEHENVVSLLRETRNHMTWGIARFGMDEKSYLETLANIREKKFGIRLPVYLGETVQDDGLAAIAVPIFKLGKPIGAITLLFPRKYQRPEKFADQHLHRLVESALRITNDLDHFEPCCA